MCLGTSHQHKLGQEHLSLFWFQDQGKSLALLHVVVYPSQEQVHITRSPCSTLSLWVLTSTIGGSDASRHPQVWTAIDPSHKRRKRRASTRADPSATSHCWLNY